MKQVDIDIDKMIDLYVNQELTAKACALKLGVSQSALVRRLKKNKITIRPPIRRLITDIDDEQILDLYFNQKLSKKQVAIKLDRSEGFVRGRLKRAGATIRTTSEGSRLWRGSDDIPDDQLIYLYDICGWSCEKISAHFNKSSQFTRQRFMAIGKKRRKNIGQNNGSWKGGITDIRNAVRSCAASMQWRNNAFVGSGYKSDISGMGGQLNCHHIYPFHVILRASITKHTPLPDEYRSLAIIGDHRFYDMDNALVVSEYEHDKIEDGKLEQAHPWWKIWKAYPDFVVQNTNLTTDDLSQFGNDGQIEPHGYILHVSTADEIRQLVKYEHYLGTLPGSKLILVAKINNIIIGAATFGKGTNRHIPNDSWELTRLCVPFYVVKPFACTFLSRCCEYIRENCEDIKNLISFADSSVGHNGAVYRMSGWSKCGKTLPSYAYFNPNTMELRHKSSCRRIEGIDKTEKELAQERGLIRIPLGIKYKYNIYL